MPAIGDFQGGHDRIRIAHFTDHDDVRVLAQGLNRPVFERKHITPDFAMPDDAPVTMTTLSRTFIKLPSHFNIGIDTREAYATGTGSFEAVAIVRPAIGGMGCPH